MFLCLSLRAPPVSLWGTFLCTLPVPSFLSPLFLSPLFLEPIWLSVPGITSLGVGVRAVIPSPVSGPPLSCWRGSPSGRPPCFWARSFCPVILLWFCPVIPLWFYPSPLLPNCPSPLTPQVSRSPVPNLPQLLIPNPSQPLTPLLPRVDDATS